ncbi:Elongation of fatty acids protein 3-like protein, partial [Cucurbita argyrosperma subsp. argyrosperma]
MKAGIMPITDLTYWLSEHPSIVGFRWSHTHSWGSTWSFLFSSIVFYLAFSIAIHLFLSLLLRPGRPVPLGPIPAIHCLSMALISTLISAGTRPSGRVFFWSYIYYLSRFFHMFRTIFTILRRRELSFFQLFNHSISTFMSFLWLEFSQSFQVLAILSTSLLYAVVYGYRFWTAIGLRRACFPFVMNCQIALLGCNLACHVGVLMLHFMKGGCNGIGAWGFNSVLNGAILLLFLNFYLKIHVGKTKSCVKIMKQQPCSGNLEAENLKEKNQ